MFVSRLGITHLSWKRYLLRLICCVCLWGATGGHAAESLPPLVPEASFFVRTWTVDDGTPLNTVIGVRRRSDGYLWVITRQGLFRFDGVKYRSVLKLSDDVLPGLITPALCEDSRGRLWLSKGNGVIACVDGANVRVFTMTDGLPALKPRSMAGDSEGAVWISYWETSTLFQIKEGQVQSFGGISGPAGNDRTVLSSDSKRNVWFACGQQVGVLRDNRMVPLLTNDQPVTCLAPTREGGIWFSADRQVWKCREDGTLETSIQVPEGSVTVLHEDLGGHLWVGALAAGGGRLFRLEGREFRSIQVACPFIRSLSDDREGNLWVSTRRTGLIQVRQRTVELMIPKADAPAGFSSFCEDMDGRRFAVVNNRLLLFSQESGWAPLQTKLGQPDRNFFCVTADPAGGLWASARTKRSGQEQTELLRWRDNDLFSASSTHFNSRSPIIRTLFVGSKGELWLGMQEDGELCCLRDGLFKTFSVPPGNGTVCAMTEDAAGTLWAATVGGLLLRVTGESLVEQTPQLPGAPDSIRTLHATPDGNLWIGYETRGLGLLRKGGFFLFGQEQGLEDDAVSQILSDDAGWLWCAGDRGIFRLRRDELEAMAAGKVSKLHPVLCGRGEGWPVLQAACGNWPQAMRSRSGELCMPTGAGLAVIRPGSVRDAPQPAVVIERVSVNGRLVAAYESGKFLIRGQAASTTDLCGQAARLSLGQGVRQLSFDYVAVSFTGQEHVRFRYQLEGLDDAWVEAGPQRAAYYSLVPSGHYRFRVSACNNAGIWNETGVTLAFTVEPFFWQTWWFQLLAWLVAGAVAGGAIFWEIRRRLRVQAAARQQAEGEFKAVWNERNRMARELHDTLAQGLSAISMQLELLKRKLPADSPARGVLDETREMTKSSLAEARNSIWNMRSQVLETGDLTTALEGILKAIPNGCKIESVVQVKGTPRRLAPVTENNLLRIGQEAIANAVRYAQCGRIEVTLVFEESQIELSVRDDGQGFDPDNPPRSEGGFGLAGMRERAEQMHGEFHVISAPGKGTMVRVVVPNLLS